MNCQVCGKAKQAVSPKKSAIANGVTLLVCDSCREKKYEPRHLIIIVGRSKGPAAVRDVINKRLYVGEKIAFEDVIV